MKTTAVLSLVASVMLSTTETAAAFQVTPDVGSTNARTSALYSSMTAEADNGSKKSSDSGPRPLKSLLELKKEYKGWAWRSKDIETFSQSKETVEVEADESKPKPLKSLFELKRENKDWAWKMPQPLPTLKDLKRENGDWKWRNKKA